MRHHEDELNVENASHRRNNFPRQLTETIVNTINLITDTDGEWSKQIIEDYAKIDDKGPGKYLSLESIGIIR